MPLKSPFDSIQAWLIDMDGVIYRGAEPLPGAAEFVRTLQQEEQAYLFLTNNATKTPDQSVTRLALMGIHVEVSSIFTSALATEAYMTEHFPPPRCVLVVGGNGIRTAVPQAGFELVTRAEQAELVVSALDQEVTYAQLAEAALAINAGCPWIATNPDPTFPSERGILPGAGSIIAMLAAATGQAPLIMGKPEPGIYDQALALLGSNPRETIMLGDRLSTDILGGHRAGINTMCVLTGVSGRAEAEAYQPRPDFIIEGLPELLAN